MGSRVTTRLVAVLLLAGAAGCGGKPIGASTGGAGDGGAGTGAAAGANGAAGTGAAGARVVSDPGFVGLRLLSRREYDNTVRDLLGVEGQARSSFTPERRDNDFDNGDENSVVLDVVFEGYFNEAERLSAAVFADPSAARARRRLPSAGFDSRRVRAGDHSHAGAPGVAAPAHG